MLPGFQVLMYEDRIKIHNSDDRPTPLPCHICAGYSIAMNTTILKDNNFLLWLWISNLDFYFFL